MIIDLTLAKKAILAFALTLVIVPVVAQVKSVNHPVDDFNKQLAEASISFHIPERFKEIKLSADADALFDYGAELRDDDFVVMVQANPLKQNWEAFEKQKNDTKRALPNPDSAYLAIAQATAAQLAGNENCFTKDLPTNMLWHFNASKGKSYLLNLIDAQFTRHYKYGLLVALQKDRVGSLILFFMSDDSGPDFFRKVRKVSAGIHFKS